MPPPARDALTEEILTTQNHNFFPALDFVRAVAVVLVVIDHTLLALRVKMFFGVEAGFLGLVGVWMFFVHTALVLMWSLERKPYTLDFYIRRIFRIYPLALVAIAVALLTRAPLTGTVDNFFQYHRTTPGNLVATALLVYNLAPPHLAYHPIVNVIWTLPLEVQMYLFLPVLFSFVRRDRTLWPLFLMWCLGTAISQIYFKGGVNLITSVPNFLPGVMAFVAFKRVHKRLPAWGFPITLFALIALLLYASRTYASRPSFGWPFSLALGLLLPQFQSFAPSIFTRACHQLAKHSYGIYLAHPFALILGVYLLYGHSLILQVSVEIATIAVISVASYRLIEKPMIDLGSRLAARLELSALNRHGRAQRSL